MLCDSSLTLINVAVRLINPPSEELAVLLKKV